LKQVCATLVYYKCNINHSKRNRYTVVGIGTRLRAGRSGIWILAGERDFSIPCVFQSCCHFEVGVKRPGRVTDHFHAVSSL